MFENTILITGVNSVINAGNNQFNKVTTMMPFEDNPGFKQSYEFGGLFWQDVKVDRYTFQSESCHGGTIPIHYYSFLN